jgi:Tfp pilus assembly protein PilO
VKALNSMTQTRKATLIGVAVLLAMLVVGWMFVLTPRSDAVAAANEKVKVAAAANDQLRSTIAARRAQEARLPELRKISKALDGRFPPSAQQPELYKMVTAAAGRAGIAPGEVTNLTVNPPVSGTSGQPASAQLPGVAAVPAQIASQQVTMDVKGSEAQIRKMVANLEDLPRAFEVTTVSLSNPATGAKGDAVQTTTATITGQMVVMPALKDPTLAAKAKAAPAK